MWSRTVRETQIPPGFEACGDVDAVAVDVVAIGDDVAEIDPDAKSETPLLGEV